MRSLPGIVMPRAPKLYAETCGTCKYAKDMTEGTQSNAGDGARLCKRHPPQVTALIVSGPGGQPQIANQAAWPTVVVTWEACGEYKQRIITPDA